MKNLMAFALALTALATGALAEETVEWNLGKVAVVAPPHQPSPGSTSTFSSAAPDASANAHPTAKTLALIMLSPSFRLCQISRSSLSFPIPHFPFTPSRIRWKSA